MFAFSLHVTELVRHWCVCNNVPCRLYDHDGAIMPTGAVGVTIPSAIITHSHVGEVLVLCKFCMKTVMCLCCATIAASMLHAAFKAAIGHTSYWGCVLD